MITEYLMTIIAVALEPERKLPPFLPLFSFSRTVLKGFGEPLTHVNFFSEESLSKCLKKAGFDVMHLSTKNQLTTSGDRHCIKIVGRKNKGNTRW